jgi:hypothetical protein
MSIHLNDLKNEIIKVPANHPVFIYIGVGAAASAKNNLSLDQYQQFPPFLQDIRNQYPNLHLFLLLFDPYQESPPQVAIDFALHDPSNSDTHYQSADGLLQAFVYRHAVYTEPYLNPQENAVNITDTLRDLNKFAKDKRASLVYHDFTGRSTALLASYFDRENMQYLDQIVYGLSAREDHGCSFDLTQANAYFPIRLDKSNLRPVLKMFNYYSFILNNTYADSAAELQKFPEEMHNLAVIQKNQIVNNIRNQFKTTLLTLLRQLRNILINPPSSDLNEQKNLQEQGNYMFNAIPHPYRKIFEDLYNEKNYSLLYEIILNYTASELNIIVNLNEMDMSGEDILTFIIMDEDPYKWYNNINGLL